MPFHGILDDSSFAAVATPEGNRHVFFQDRNGTLRQATYAQSSSVWNVAMNHLDIDDVRHLTPISATVREDTNLLYVVIPLSLIRSPCRLTVEQVYLFYIHANNSLGGQAYSPGRGWQGFPAIGQEMGGFGNEFPNLSNFVAAEGSRSLSVSLVPRAAPVEICIFFEGKNHTMTAMYGAELRPPSNDPSWIWKDLTNGTVSSDYSNATCGPPFGSGIFGSYSSTGVNGSTPYIGPWLKVTMFCATPDSTFPLTATYDTFGPRRFLAYLALPSIITAHDEAAPNKARFHSGIWYQPFAQGSRHTLDFDLVAIDAEWILARGGHVFFVDQGQLSELQETPPSPEKHSAPTSQFPYSRIAATTPANSTVIYIYHQINATTIAEDILDESLGTWTSFDISIATG